MSGDVVKWPSWRFGPNGENGIFENAAAVPEGWIDSISEARRRDVDDDWPKEKPAAKKTAGKTDKLEHDI